MSSSPWVRHPSEPDFDVLEVPIFSQPEGENECMPYSIKMVLEYIHEAYPNPMIREDAPEHNISEIRSFLTIRRAGWVPDEDELAELSTSTSPIQFEHDHWETPPATLPYGLIEDKLEENLPVILVIDARELREGVGDRGPDHAVVVTGLDRTRVAINDPWGYHYDVVDRTALEQAWDGRFSQLVKVDIGIQGTLQEESEEVQE